MGLFRLKRQAQIAGTSALADAGWRSARLRTVISRLSATDAGAARWAAAAGAALVIVLAVPLAALLNIWVDEAFTLHTTGAGPFVAWSRAISFEIQPPFYFTLLGAWRLVDEGSVFFARLPSIAFAAAAVAVIVATAHRVAPRIPPFAFAIALAVNPYVLLTAVEMRVYALSLLIGALLVWTFTGDFLVANSTRRVSAAYAAVGIVALYTQYYLGFILLANAVAVLLVRRRAFPAFAATASVIALTFVPFIPTLLGQLHESNGFVISITLLHAVHETLNAAYQFVLPHLPLYGHAKVAALAITAVLGVVVFWFGRPAFSREPVANGIVVTCAAALLAFSVVFAIDGEPFSIAVHTVALAPAALLVMLVLLSSLTRNRVAVMVTAAVVYAGFTAAMLAQQYAPPLAKSGDWQRVSAAVTAADQTTPVAVFPAESALPLDWYLRTPVLPIPAPMPFNANYIRATSLSGEAQVARVLDPVRARASRLWLVTNDCDAAVARLYNYHCNFLEAYLARHYRVVEKLAFKGSDARLLERIGAPLAVPKHKG